MNKESEHGKNAEKPQRKRTRSTKQERERDKEIPPIVAANNEAEELDDDAELNDDEVEAIAIIEVDPYEAHVDVEAELMNDDDDVTKVNGEVWEGQEVLANAKTMKGAGGMGGDAESETGATEKALRQAGRGSRTRSTRARSAGKTKQARSRGKAKSAAGKRSSSASATKTQTSRARSRK